ncbi:DUF2782 domain-containing protein [Marinospirillum perlucidum]|uniref:DUF2782 domain-containing protein n=1 Tax=Marinospirillum perlucidum TaxID=1982602 RepID=UPI000DF38F8F|nr:DUF2782 domain-containing protein [Marinospirillum perlucidum]
MQKIIAAGVALIATGLLAASLWANDPVDSEIVIRESEDKVIEEFWVAGKLKAIKVTPRRGEPYFLVDPDGLDLDDQERGSMRLPSWKIFQW